MQAKERTEPPAQNEPIAIIGVGCRFPGDANDPDSFWGLLCRGVDAVTEVPATRWNLEEHFHETPGIPGKTYSRWGGFVKDIEAFDPESFGISPREASCMDPQQRMLLEVSWEALEDAGLPLTSIAGTNVGVFMGISQTDYANIQSGRPADGYSATGGAASVAANRISYWLNTSGPSVAVDTACSSALVATHLACQSIWTHESELALAGGVNAILSVSAYIAFCAAHMLSPVGRCKAFDAAADGFVRAEGAGVAVLKPLSRALADGDTIYAAIAGSGVNQDGHTSGIALPNQVAQETLIRTVCARAGVAPAEVDCVEAHGTGTQAGDPIEASSLGRVLSRGRGADDYCILGSVKTNIGHLESAAGIAGLIKAALMLKHRQIPPSLHFQKPNPNIPFDDLKLRIPTTLEEWPQSTRPATVAVNSFGFGGTNAHVLLTEAERRHGRGPRGDARSGPWILPISARSSAALEGLVRSYHSGFAEERSGAGVSLEDVCFTASVKRSHFEHRLAAVVRNRDHLAELLDAYLQGERRAGIAFGKSSTGSSPKVAFVFSGQGPQWWGMGRELLEHEPVFRSTLEQCDALLSRHADWSLIEELSREEASSRIQETAIAQPALFALQVGLWELWRSWGIEPEAVIGHSVGEVAAAYAAGALTLPDAVKIIFFRGYCMDTASSRGRMLAVGLSPEDATVALRGLEDRVSLAAVNGPQAVALSGDPELLHGVAESLERRGVFCRFLEVGYAFHSPQMEPVRESLVSALQGVEPQRAIVPMISTVTGRPADGSEFVREYWWSNVRQTVQFAPAMQHLLDNGCDAFVELSPHPVLSGPVSEMLLAAGKKGHALPSLRRHESEPFQMLSSLGELYVAGYPVDWQRLFPSGSRQVQLPRYKWARARYWYESEAERERRLDSRRHPLLGKRQDVTSPVWRTQVDRRVLRYLEDHRVQGQVVFPGACFSELAIAAGHEMFGDAMLALEDVQIQQALFLPDAGEAPAVEFVYHPEDASYEIFSRARNDDPDWLCHVIGHLEECNDAIPSVDRPELEGRMEEVSPDEYYGVFEMVGFAYGPSFRGIKKLWRGDGEALGRIELSEDCRSHARDYRFHPALLDPCTQVILATIRDAIVAGDLYYLPVCIQRLRFFARPDGHVFSHMRLTQLNKNGLEADIRIFDESGKVLVDVQGYQCRALERQSARETPLGLLFETGWYEKSLRDRSEEAVRPSLREIVRSSKRELITLDRELGWSKTRDRAAPALDTLAAAYAWRALQELGESCRFGEVISLRSLVDRRNVLPRYERFTGRLMALLERNAYVMGSGREKWQVKVEGPVEDPQACWQRTFADSSALLPELVLLDRFGTQLSSALRGAVDPAELLFPDGSTEMAERYYEQMTLPNTAIRLCSRRVLEKMGQGREVRILEIGGGTGVMTADLLSVLPQKRIRYVFTDVNRLLLERAAQKFRLFPFVDFRQLDIEQDPVSQGFELHSFDLVLASHVFHMTRNLRETLTNVFGLLASGGFLLFLEAERAAACTELIFGAMEGWGRFADHELRPEHPLIDASRWGTLLHETGFQDVASLVLKSKAEERPVLMLAGAPSSEPATPTGPCNIDGQWLIFQDTQGVGEKLASLLRDGGGEVVCVARGDAFRQTDRTHFDVNPASSDDVRELCRSVSSSSDLRGVIHLWSLDAVPTDEASGASLQDAERWGCHSLVHLVQALEELELWGPALRLLCVTRNAQPVGDDMAHLSVSQSPVLGLGRVIRNEHPNIGSKLVDLGPEKNVEEEARLLLCELGPNDPEPEIALRRKSRFVPRIRKLEAETRPIDWSSGEPSSRFSLAIPTPGALDRLQIIEADGPEIGPGEVEIQVIAAALNFRDVMKVLGFYPTDSPDAFILGDECAGRISRVGEGVDHLKVGDEVVAVAPGSFASHVVTRAALVARKPGRLSFPEAATMPVVFLTAYYGLVCLARLQRDERVLIHAAAGGVGLAAVQIAQHIGAQVYATAGSPEKRQLLRRIGVRSVMDSRSVAFAREIRKETGGEGVDVVLNSLSGQAIAKGVASLAPNGRFIELGKRDIYQNSKLGLWNFRKNLSYFAVDLGRLLSDSTVLTEVLCNEFSRMLRARNFRPLPHCSFPISRAVDGFRRMAQAKHVGKIVFSMRDSAPAARRPELGGRQLRPDGTYLITGGFGGYGLIVARWCVDRGARCVVLMGRSGAVSDEAKRTIAQLEGRGARIEEARADVTRRDQVAEVLDRIARTMPPLRGVFHLAMVLDDGIVLQQTPERFASVTGPKMIGAWNLHEQTLDRDLDCFVLFSSVSSLLGNPGQSNYAAGNAFLDALAHYRRARGLPAATINWGALAEAGYLAEHEVRSDVVKANRGLSPLEAMAALDRVITENRAQVAALRVDWSAIRKAAGRTAPVLEFVLPQDTEETETEDERVGIGEAIARAPEEERSGLLVAYLRTQIAKVLGTAPDRLDDDQPLNEVGLDSLMGVELKNRVESDLRIALPVATLLQAPSVSQFAEKIRAQLFGQSQSALDRIAKEETPEEMLANVDRLSDDEVETLLGSLAQESTTNE